MVRYLQRNKTTRRRKISFKDPFTSAAPFQPAQKVFVAPMVREGVTSIENAERSRMAKRLAQMGNAGILKQMKTLGVIPDDYGVDMSAFTGDSVSLPSGVTSIAQVEKQQNALRQIDRFNAGILDQKSKETQALLEIAKKKKESEGRKKIIQYLAESDELDEVPLEFREEVEKYYGENKDKELKNKVLKKRLDRKKKEEEEAQRKLDAQLYWERPRTFVQPVQRESTTYTTYKPISDTQLTRNDEVLLERMIQDAYQNWLLQNPNLGDLGFLFGDNEEYYQTFLNEWNPPPEVKQLMYKLGRTSLTGHGWRAPRLHKLIAPVKPFNIGDSPEKIVEDQKQQLDERRKKYKEEQHFQRGSEPPKNMVERAFPKLAAPIEVPPEFRDTFSQALQTKFNNTDTIADFLNRKHKLHLDPLKRKRKHGRRFSVYDIIA